MKSLLLLWVTVSSINIRELPSWVQIPPNVTKLEPKYYLMQYQEDLLLPCTVTGNPKPTVKWMKNGKVVDSEWSEVLPNGSLMLYNQTYQQMWQREKELPGAYYCIASNSLGTDFGNVINVRLPLKPNYTRKKVKTKSLNMGQQLAIRCDAPIPPGSEVTRVWSYKNFTTIPINAMKRVTALQNGEILFFSNIISKDNNLNIYCQAHEKVTRMAFQGKSYYFTVRNADRSPTKRAPKIYDNNTTKSAVISAVVGRAQVLECVAGGVPTPEIKWEVTKKDGVKNELTNDGNIRLIGRNTALEIITVSDNDAGRYRCIANNGQGVDMKDFVVEINSEPVFVERPNEVLVEPGAQLTTRLNCQASGQPVPTIKWFKNNRELTESENKNSIEIETNLSQDTANYQCKISNKYAQITSSAQVLVLGNPPRSFAGKDVSSFDDEVRRIAGKTASLKCGLFGHPTPNFKWYDLGPLKQTKGVRPDYVDSDREIANCSGQEVCSIPNVSEDRLYKCIASNSYGEGSVRIKLIKLAPTAVTFKQSPIEARNSSRVRLEPIIEVDPYFTNYTVTWTKLDKTKGNKQLGSAEQLVVDKAIIYKDDGKYEIRVKTEQDEAVQVVRLILQDVPEPPLECSLENSDQGVKVKFEPGFDNYAPILSYRIQFAVIDPLDTNKMYDWEEKGSLDHDKSKTVQEILIRSSQLVPWTNYTVHVQSRNEIGYSAASARDNKYATILTRAAAPTQYVEKITASGQVGPGILRLLWTPISPLNYNGPGFNHIVIFCPVGQSVTSGCFDKCTEQQKQVKLSATASQYDIKGKLPYTKYAYKLSTLNDEGAGPETQCKYDYSGEEKPSQGPTNLRHVQITSNSVMFAWDAVPVAALKGKLRGYRIQYKSAQDGFQNTQTKETDQMEEAELLNLKPATKYEIKVAAVNGAGAGDYSRKLLITTEPDYPGTPRNLSIMSIKPDSFNIGWLEPLDTNGEITGYTYQVIGNDGKEVGSTPIQGGRRSRIDIPNLTPDTKYTIKLFAVNAKGKSRLPIIVTNRTLTYEKARPQQPSKLTNVNLINGDVNVTWSITSNDFPPDNFTLLYKYTDFENDFETITIDNIETPFKVIKNLKPGANITVRLYATNKYGSSKETSLEFETDVGAVLEGNIWFIAVLIGVGITFILIIIFCFVQHSKSGKYPVQNKTMDMMVEDHETTPEDKTLLPPSSPSPCKSPNVTVYAPGDLRKASSEASDSIVGFGEGGHVTRHYTENGSFIGQYAPGADSSQRNSVESGNSPEESDLKTFAPA